MFCISNTSLPTRTSYPTGFIKLNKEILAWGDWSETIQNYLSELGITLSHEEISRMSKIGFQSLVKDKIRKSAFVIFDKKRRKRTKKPVKLRI